MFLGSGRAPAKPHYHLFQLLAVALFVMVVVTSVSAQGGTDYTGTGGVHAIQGRLFFPSGRRSDLSVKVQLQNMTAGTLTVFADAYGTFNFRNLTGGSYTLVIEPTDYYEAVRESVFIDDGGNQMSRNTARVINVPIHLQLKREAQEKLGVLNAALAHVPKKAVELFDKALESGRTDDPKKAVELLNQALAIYPDFPLALSLLGVQHLKLTQLDKAIEALTSAVRLSPEDAEARLNLGIALLNRGEFLRADEELRRVLHKNPQIATAHMYLGMAALKLNRHDDALSELQRATSLPGGEQLAQAHKLLGGLYWRKGEFRLAADSLEKYLKVVPKAPDAEKIRTTIKEFRKKG